MACGGQGFRNDTPPDGDKGGRATPTDAVAAQGQCKSDPASAIPVLEKALKAARLSLPSRG